MVSTVHFRVPRPVWREGLLIFIPALALYLMKGQPSLTAGPQAPVKALSQKTILYPRFYLQLVTSESLLQNYQSTSEWCLGSSQRKGQDLVGTGCPSGTSTAPPHSLCDRGNPSELLLPYKEQQCSFKIITNKDSLGKHLGRGTLYALTNDCHHTAWLSCVCAPKWTQGWHTNGFTVLLILRETLSQHWEVEAGRSVSRSMEHSTLALITMINAGVHLCHGVKSFYKLKF